MLDCLTIRKSNKKSKRRPWKEGISDTKSKRSRELSTKDRRIRRGTERGRAFGHERVDFELSFHAQGNARVSTGYRGGFLHQAAHGHGIFAEFGRERLYQAGCRFLRRAPEKDRADGKGGELQRSDQERDIRFRAPPERRVQRERTRPF